MLSKLLLSASEGCPLSEKISSFDMDMLLPARSPAALAPPELPPLLMLLRNQVAAPTAAAEVAGCRRSRHAPTASRPAPTAQQHKIVHPQAEPSNITWLAQCMTLYSCNRVTVWGTCGRPPRRICAIMALAPGWTSRALASRAAASSSSPGGTPTGLPSTAGAAGSPPMSPQTACGSTSCHQCDKGQAAEGIADTAELQG